MLRRMKHTPDLLVPMVVSEPTECKLHGCKFVHDARGRVMFTTGGGIIPLFMSASGLGWLKVKPVTCADNARSFLKRLSRGSILFRGPSTDDDEDWSDDLGANTSSIID